MFLLNNQPIQLDVQFETSDGTHYPANWLRLASPEERSAIGIIEVPDPQPYDPRFYNADGSPRDLNVVKAEQVGVVNREAYGLLLPSDWMVIRSSEGTPVPQQWTDYRAAVRTTANLARTEIESATTIDALINAVNAVIWPEQPVNN